MKSHTDIPQSKKLMEFLPHESADMYYQYVLPKSDRIKHNPEIGNPISALEWYNKGYTMSGKEPITMDEYCVPCWSLAALLDVYPMCVGRNSGTFRCWVDSKCICSDSFDNPIDACVDMIIKLKERNLI